MSLTKRCLCRPPHPGSVEVQPCADSPEIAVQGGNRPEFDENAPLLKAIPTFSVEEMTSCVGVAKGKYDGLSDGDLLDATRGKADACDLSRR